MLSFKVHSTDDLARSIAARFRDRRLEYAWSRDELGARAGVAVPTLRQFEETGKISLERLLKLAHALGLLSEFQPLAIATTPVRTLAQLETRETAPRRQRGRTRRPAAL